MRALYLDCFSGISGDMTLAALLDAGVDERELRRQLASLPIADEFKLTVQKLERYGVVGTDIEIAQREHDKSGHAHRGYSGIVAIIKNSEMTGKAKATALTLFKRLGEAEAAVHGVDLEEIHFHELGAVDSIVDICGVSIALDLLGIDNIFSSALNLGGGTVRCAHGVLPVPAPATAELLKNFAPGVYLSGSDSGELVTPTGAVIASLASGTQPEMIIESIGYGFGKRDTGSLNALRVMIGEIRQGALDETSILLETNLDDMTGEDIAYAMERLVESGAQDVWLTPIQMKKGRPGVVLSVLCSKQTQSTLKQQIFKHTSTLGVRTSEYRRSVLKREFEILDTELGKITLKRSALEDSSRVKPEFDDVATAAKANSLSLEQARNIIEKAIMQEGLDG